MQFIHRIAQVMIVSRCACKNRAGYMRHPMSRARYTQSTYWNGIKMNVFATKNTIPSIAIGVDSNVCYIDLVLGESPKTLNVRYNGQTYHAVPK